LERLAEFSEHRRTLGTRLSEQLADVEGISVKRIAPGSKHSYFLYLFKLDLDVLGCLAEEFAQALKAEGVNAKAHLLTGGRPVYLYHIFQKRSAFPGSQYPFRSQDTGADRSYPPGLCPIAEDAFNRWMTLELTENYTEQNIDEIAFAIAKVAYHKARRPALSQSR